LNLLAHVRWRGKQRACHWLNLWQQEHMYYMCYMYYRYCSRSVSVPVTARNRKGR